MPIQSGDIKLLKSAVMADTDDGGGAMTGVELIDGLSNNLFPDTSASDRATGRFQARKLFGASHTDDTATLMGAHAIITDAPDDPRVLCALLKTPGWFDTRTAARSLIERYLAKGPRLPPRLYDRHYAGSMQVKLISFVSTVKWPAIGDCIVLRNPDGAEQYVRIVKIETSAEDVALWENNSTIIARGYVATCHLAQELAYDFLGPAPARVLDESKWAQVYSTTIAGSAKMYGIKPLAQVGAPGDYSVVTEGGIYTQIVPAATIESPVIDQFPLAGRGSVITTARAAMTLPPTSRPLGPGDRIALPSAVEPGSIAFTHGTTAFAADSTGNLMQGTLVVGAVDHAAGMISMATTAPNYGTAVMTLTYRPSSAVTAATHSGATMITTANQGRAFTDVLEPPPAPGSLSISFMAQGRWYELLDNMAGKIVGADSSYGVGTINYATGSLSVTLGAIPDVDSALIYTWGDSATAKGIVGDLPARAWSKLAMPARARLDGLTLQWSRDAVNYTAVMDAAGVLSGDAQGRAEGGHIRFEPDVFPDGQVTIVCDLGPESSNLVNGNIIQNLQLTAGLPIVPGSFTGKVLATFPPNATSPESPVNVFDRDGIVYVDAPNGGGALGVIDYNTGVISCQGSLNIKIMVDVVKTYADGPLKGEQYVAMEEQTKAIAYSGVTVTSYAYGSGVQQHTVQRDPLPWVVQVPVAGSRMVLTGCAFKLGSDIYTASAGTLLRGWNLANGQPTSAAAGTINSAGLITLASLPGNFTNGLQWFNAAVDLSGGLVTAGVFRTDNAPLKQGVFQLQIGARVGTINASGVLSGGDFSGSVDSYRGIVRWRNVDPIDVSALSYNTVFLQYLPLDSTLLGIGTSSLPLDGRVPIFRAGDLCVVHHTQALTLPNPVPRDAVHTLGRQRLATVRVLDALGAVVADTLYTADLDAGTMSVPAASDLSGYVQPLTVEHRIEDMLQCTEADISGRLKFSQSLTHDFPAGSYVSSALQFGDLFARVSTYIEQATWTSVWQDTRIGSAITANFNEAAFPIAVTNRGAITERWAMIFTATTTFRIVGESVGEIGTGSVNEACAPINPATLTPYFSIPPLGWGGGWSAGNVLRFNTSACGAPFWVVRTVLQGPASVTSDRFTVAFRGDVDRP